LRFSRLKLNEAGNGLHSTKRSTLS